MTEDDLEAVLAAEKVQFPESPWNKDAFLYELNENPFALLYCDEEEKTVRGYADLWIMYDQAQIANIAVCPGFLKRGIGSGLLEHCIREAERNGCEYVSLEVRTTNIPALALYEKYGFIRAARRKGYYENGEDAWLMIRPAGGLNDDDDTGD